ncbi:hypothetical protein FOMPIDRAFT_1052512 [Fomitopsis schrenkii]|uniref:Uncharacterized protein n=1 Tax=Fomitopsis schrenkii TaxID=2126942 RepID=S8F6M4_FOMSC|nr:hypothetical protein FOMPIDRAFT_1052512 [Fomitopsis schrenkii]
MSLTLAETHDLALYILTNGQEGHLPVAIVNPPTLPPQSDIHITPSSLCGHANHDLASRLFSRHNQGRLRSALNATSRDVQPASKTHLYPADQRLPHAISDKPPHDSLLFNGAYTKRSPLDRTATSLMPHQIAPPTPSTLPPPTSILGKRRRVAGSPSSSASNDLAPMLDANTQCGQLMQVDSDDHWALATRVSVDRLTLQGTNRHHGSM